MLEEYINYLETIFTKRILEDKTIVFDYKDYKKIVEIYAPLNQDETINLIKDVVLSASSYKRKVAIPDWFLLFLLEANGMDIFYSAIAFGGKQTIQRTNLDLHSPYDLGEYNRARSYKIPQDLLGIGAYGYNHSDIFTNLNGEISVYNGDYHDLLVKNKVKKFLDYDTELLFQCETIEKFLLEETKRLFDLFNNKPWDRFTYSYPETVPNYVYLNKKK